MPGAGAAHRQEAPLHRHLVTKMATSRRIPESGTEPPVAPPGETAHWLVRPTTVRGLWIGFGVVLTTLVLGDFLVHAHPGFGIDGSFGFYAWYGLGTCVVMVLFAKGLGVFLKRRDDYYEDPGAGHEGDD